MEFEVSGDKERGQGALEYLIIIGAVIAIAAIVVTTVSSMLHEQRIQAQISEMKDASSTCNQILTSEGKEPGEPSYELCSDTCSEWKDQEGCGNTYTQLTEKGFQEVHNPYEACLAGKPEWIRRRTTDPEHLLCDGFNGEDLNRYKWGVIGPGDVELEDGEAIISTPNGTATLLWSVEKFNESVLEFRAKYPDHKWIWGGFRGSAEDCSGLIAFDTWSYNWGPSHGATYSRYYTGSDCKGATWDGMSDKMIGKWHNYKIVKTGDKIEFYMDSHKEKGDRSPGPGIPMFLDFTNKNRTSGGYRGPTEIEWVKVTPIE